MLRLTLAADVSSLVMRPPRPLIYQRLAERSHHHYFCGFYHAEAIAYIRSCCEAHLDISHYA